MNGTGSPTSHPLTSTTLRVNRSANKPEAIFETALTAPKARMNDKIRVSEVR